MIQRYKDITNSILKDVAILFLFAWVIHAIKFARPDISVLLFLAADIYMMFAIILLMLDIRSGQNELSGWRGMILGEALIWGSLLFNPIMKLGFGFWISPSWIVTMTLGIYRLFPAIVMLRKV